jgi:hypothetical protein
MPTHQSLEALISEKAEEIADHLLAIAKKAQKEETIRVETEKQLGFLQKEAKISLHGEHEFTVASGFVDSLLWCGAVSRRRGFSRTRLPARGRGARGLRAAAAQHTVANGGRSEGQGP